MVGLTLPIRLLLFRRNVRTMEPGLLEHKKGVLSVPFSEFYSDVSIWVLNGVISATASNALYGVPYSTGIKVIIGCFTAGILVGMTNFLEMERSVIDFLRRHANEVLVRPRLTMSVSRKVSFLFASVMTVSALVIVFMLLNDVSFLLKNRLNTSSEAYNAILYEVGFVIGVMLLFSFWIISRFSRNLSTLFELQMGTLEKVERGIYDASVPIVTTDEFGVIASQTNRMITGLKERDFIRETFGKYVSKEVSDLILSENIPLDGELRVVTMLFCDIRRYTTYVESTPPKEVLKRINRYFTEMTAAISEYNGLVLQFVGDEIEAVFGAPFESKNHPELAVKAALEMRQRLSELNRTWVADGDAPFQHGIGIHTGEVLAGNIGSPDRLSYLMVGDTVNLASRLQNLTKDFDCDILISGATRKCLSDGLQIEHVQKLKLRGKYQETDVFRIV